MRALVLVLALGLGPSAAAGESIGALGAAEQGWTLGLGALALALPAMVSGPENARWRSPLPLDGAVNRWIGVTTHDGAARASSWSDWTLTAIIGTSVVATGDSGAHGRWQAAQSYAVTGIATSAIKALAGRARPYVEQCRDNPLGLDCFSSYQNEGFVSGHAAFAFTGAGLLCAMSDEVLCGAGVGLASVVGVLRVVGQQHYLTDVLAGAVLGWVSGNTLTRWRRKERAEVSAALFSVQLAW